MVSCGWIGSRPRGSLPDLFTNREEHLADRPKTKIPKQLVKPAGRLVEIQVVAEFGEERPLHARLRGVDLP
jgi:hypothetical protein